LSSLSHARSPWPAPLLLAGMVGLFAACGLEDARVLAEVDAHLETAAGLLDENNLDDAILEYEAALTKAPDHAAVLLYLGSAYTAVGRLDEAESTLAELYRLHPDAVAAVRAQAELRVKTGDLDGALEKFAEAGRLQPSDPATLLGWADALHLAGRHAEAADRFEQAARRSAPMSPDHLAVWGSCLVHTGHPEQAQARFTAALERDPGSAAANHGLGVLLVGIPEQRPAGLAHLDQALRAAPDDPAILFSLGDALLEDGRATEAVDLLQRSVAGTEDRHPALASRTDRLAAARAALPRAEASPDSPNVLLVVLDTVRADHLGTYGYPRDTTPRLDALGAEGAVFTEAISQAPWTAASIASLFTGQPPSVHGLDGGIRWQGPQEAAATGDSALPFAVQKTLHPDETTLAEALRAGGYQTAGFVSNIYVHSIFGFSQGFDRYADEHASYSADVGKVKKRAPETNAEVFDWLDAGPQEPFFLFVHYNDAHWPYDPPAPYAQTWTAGYTGTLTPDQTSAVVETRGAPVNGLSEADLAFIVGLYDGELAFLDSQVGRLLDQVAAAKLERGLLTVVIADHGEEFLDHGSASHGYTLYDEMVRVPLLVHQPGRVAPSRPAAQVRSVDVLPTVLELAGVDPVPDPIEGVSLVPLLEGRQAPARNAYSEATYGDPRVALRVGGGLKLIDNPTRQTAELYDLSTDPAEQTDLWMGARGQTDGVRLQADLQRWLDDNTARRRDGGAPEVVLDADTQAQLRELGYMP